MGITSAPSAALPVRRAAREGDDAGGGGVGAAALTAEAVLRDAQARVERVAVPAALELQAVLHKRVPLLHARHHARAVHAPRAAVHGLRAAGNTP